MRFRERTPDVRNESFWSSLRGVVMVADEVRFRFLGCGPEGWVFGSACASASASVSVAVAASMVDAEGLLAGSLASLSLLSLSRPRSISMSGSDSVASGSEKSTFMTSSVSLVSSIRGVGSAAGRALCSSARRSLAMGLLHMRHVTSTSVSWSGWSDCCVVTVRRTMPCSDSLHVAVMEGFAAEVFLGRPRGLGAAVALRTA